MRNTYDGPPDGTFPDWQRQAILDATLGRCAGCGSTWSLNIQHRRARGAGGTTNRMTPANGVALCGSGTTGCHGWVEAHPTDGLLLGWRLGPNADPAAWPFWTRDGWRRWVWIDDDDTAPGCWLVEYVDVDDVPLDYRVAGMKARKELHLDG